jgi:CRP/FNR family transcriptional regulator
MQPTIIKALNNVPYFAGLGDDVLNAIAQDVVQKTYAAGQVVFLKDEPCPGLGIVHEGLLKGVRYATSGREQIISLLRPGEIFNAVGVFANIPNPVTVIALKPTTIWLLPAERLQYLQIRFPVLTQRIVRNLAERTLALVDLVEDLSLRTVEMRLARWLLAKAQDSVMPRETWATQAEMAARLGTVTYVLNRALRSFEEAGLIDVNRQRIRILDRIGLKAKAEDTET